MQYIIATHGRLALGYVDTIRLVTQVEGLHAVCAYMEDSEFPEDMERLFRLYLRREPSEDELFALYANAALGGFLWCLWAVYKSILGDEFGEYTIIMYRYAKKYYRKLRKL